MVQHHLFEAVEGRVPLNHLRNAVAQTGGTKNKESMWVERLDVVRLTRRALLEQRVHPGGAGEGWRPNRRGSLTGR